MLVQKYFNQKVVFNLKHINILNNKFYIRYQYSFYFDNDATEKVLGQIHEEKFIHKEEDSTQKHNVLYWKDIQKFFFATLNGLFIALQKKWK